MLSEQLDFMFPFLMFGYGALMLIVLEVPYFIKIGHIKTAVWKEKYYSQLQSHRVLAWISFFIGGLWSVQNLAH